MPFSVFMGICTYLTKNKNKFWRVSHENNNWFKQSSKN
jgi:hypothetical protein